MTEQTMTSQKPYLIQAVYNWVVDNGCTPHVVVHAESQGVSVPQEFVKDGQIVLNVSPTSVRGLLFDDFGISFSARFGGVPREIYLPWFAILAVYAAENSKGMGFPLEDAPKGFAEASDADEPSLDSEPPKPSKSRSHLKVVK